MDYSAYVCKGESMRTGVKHVLLSATLLAISCGVIVYYVHQLKLAAEFTQRRSRLSEVGKLIRQYKELTGKFPANDDVAQKSWRFVLIETLSARNSPAIAGNSNIAHENEKWRHWKRLFVDRDGHLRFAQLIVEDDFPCLSEEDFIVVELVGPKQPWQSCGDVYCLHNSVQWIDYFGSSTQSIEIDFVMPMLTNGEILPPVNTTDCSNLKMTICGGVAAEWQGQ